MFIIIMDNEALCHRICVCATHGSIASNTWKCVRKNLLELSTLWKHSQRIWSIGVENSYDYLSNVWNWALWNWKWNTEHRFWAKLGSLKMFSKSNLEIFACKPALWIMETISSWMLLIRQGNYIPRLKVLSEKRKKGPK